MLLTWFNTRACGMSLAKTMNKGDNLAIVTKAISELTDLFSLCFLEGLASV